jgi:hypothetical protein
VESRDVVWIQKEFNEYFNTSHVWNGDAVEEEVSEDETELNNLTSRGVFNEVKLKEVIESEPTMIAPQQQKGQKGQDCTMMMINMVVVELISDPGKPKTFNQAWNGAMEERFRWRKL